MAIIIHILEKMVAKISQEVRFLSFSYCSSKKGVIISYNFFVKKDMFQLNFISITELVIQK
jgi:hypothetical protein